MNGWSLYSAQGGYSTTYFYSSPSSVRVTYTGTSNYGPGYLKKTITVGSYSRARLIFHHYGRSGSDYQNNDGFELSIAGVLKKQRALPLPFNPWNRIATLLAFGTVLIVLGIVLFFAKGIQDALVLPIFGVVLLIAGILYKPRKKKT